MAPRWIQQLVSSCTAGGCRAKMGPVQCARLGPDSGCLPKEAGKLDKAAEPWCLREGNSTRLSKLPYPPALLREAPPLAPCLCTRSLLPEGFSPSYSLAPTLPRKRMDKALARMRGKSLCGEREAEPATDKTTEQPDYRVRVPQRLIITASFARGKGSEEDGRKLLRKAKVSHPPSLSCRRYMGDL